MLIGRHSFIRQNKLSDVAGRIDYISNPKRQEHLYATYQTEGATPEFWKNLARENQLDFKASGTTGKCIEGREFIIALPESFVEYKADDVVRLFTDSFHKRYGVECSAALHHMFTYTRDFTSLENGMAKEGSLRQCRCVKSGFHFYGTCVCDAQDAELVKEVLGLIKWVGTMRNRGFGEVSICVEDQHE